ncbi:DUF305 domain-containing protein [Nocardioides sp. SR21]|uniref:DUF305 domain-containing protein n=1 Tax=Nocardioides sp. SR21 TaxID=2919501 RepID=UPI001FA9DCE8|nr:DUF305 domain-containing protein [Nocardioides sp. SR21]
MTATVHHVNTSDAIFMQEMILLLRRGVQDGAMADTMTGQHGGDPGLRSLARTSSAAAVGQISAMASCIDAWNAESRSGAYPRDRVEVPADQPLPATAATTRYDEELADLHGSAFDARVARHLIAHHHAVIDRSRQEMIEGLNGDSRGFARTAISQHNRELHLLGMWRAGQPARR